MAECRCPLAAASAATRTMLRHRGWDVAASPPPVLVDAVRGLLPTADGCDCAATRPARIVLSATVDGGGAVVVVTDAPRLGSAALRTAQEALGRLGVRQLHLVVRHAISAQTQTLSQSSTASGGGGGGPPLRLVVLPWSVVLMAPLDHILVPAHRRATAEERARLGPPSQLPALRADDPVARYLALRPGEVVRIDRPDGTVYWRVVVL